MIQPSRIDVTEEMALAALRADYRKPKMFDVMLMKCGPFWVLDKDSGCWNWARSTRRSGNFSYGKIKSSKDGKQLLSHRALYSATVSEIAADMTIDHLCRNTLCVNPAHLEPVSMKENILRGYGPAAINARMATCAEGHEFKMVNWAGRKQRACMTCRAIRQKVRDKSNRAQKNAYMRAYRKKNMANLTGNRA